MKQKATKRLFAVLWIAFVIALFGASGALAATAKAPKKISTVKISASESQVTLKWSKVSGVTGYYIYRKDDATNQLKKIATVKGASKVSYTLKKLQNNTQVTLCVSAYKSSKGKILEGEKSKLVSATPRVKTPGTPALKVTGNGNGTTTLKWGKISSATGYEIYQSDPAGQYKAIGTIKQGTVSTTIQGLENGKTYSFKIRAMRTVGGITAYSAYSAAVSGRPNVTPANINTVHIYYYKAKLKSAYNAPKVGASGTVSLKKGAVVTITSKASTCRCTTSNNVQVTIPLSKLTLTGLVTNNKAYYSKDVAEAYVNYKGYSSKTKYLVWVNTYSQHVYVFKGSQYNWKLDKHFMCSTGKVGTPSILGLSTIYKKTNPFQFEGCYAYYASHIKGGAIHSWLYLNGSGAYYHDGKLGSPASHGCVRVEKANSYYIYANCPVGTTCLLH